MRFWLMILLGFAIIGAGAVASYAIYSRLQTETVAIEAAPQPVVSADGAACETLVFTLEPRRIGQLYVRTAERRTISGRFAVQGQSKLDVGLRVYSPHNRLVLNGGKHHELDFSVAADVRGDYLFRFDNSFSVLTDKVIDLTYCLR